MQIKTTMRYHLTLVRVTTIKKYTNTNAGEGMEKREHPRALLVQPLWKTVWRFLKKLKKKKQSCHMIQQSHSWAYTWTKL